MYNFFLKFFGVPYKHILKPVSSFRARVSVPGSLQLWDTSLHESLRNCIVWEPSSLGMGPHS